MNDALTTILITGIFQGIVLSFILFIKKANSKANKSFALCLLSIAITLFFLLFIVEELYYVLPQLIGFNSIPLLLISPLLLFHVLFLTSPDKKFTSSDFLHFLPFIISFIIICVFIYPAPIEVKIAIYTENDMNKLPSINVFYEIVESLGFLQIAVYMIISIIIIKKHDKRIKSILSDVEHIQLRWLYILTVAGLIIDIAIFFSETIIEFNPELEPFRIYPYIGLSFLIFLISYFSIWQPEIFKSKLLEEGIKHRDIQSKQKYQRNRLSSQEMEQIYKDLIHVMEEEELFKDPEISLPVLALTLKQPVHTLSQVINTKANMTFYTFINSYRVNEVKRLITENTDESLLKIAFKAGFNSKSVFNTFFKKLTGMRPSDFKKQLSS